VIVIRARHRIRRGNVARRTERGRDLRQPEIENLSVSSPRDEDVGGFDVAVNDAFGVC
jgi:hypothetical protein